MELLSGGQVYRGTPAHPLLTFEKCKEEDNHNAKKLPLWRAVDIQHKRQNRWERVSQESIPILKLHQLPHLPDWASPNGWDFWGRPWAYMDAPSGHPTIGVTSDTGST